MQRACEEEYLKDPTDLIKLTNHIMYQQCFPHDYERCRGLYDEALERMRERGPDNGFLLYNYAVYQAALNQVDWDDVLSLAERARNAVDMKAGNPPYLTSCKNLGAGERFNSRPTASTASLPSPSRATRGPS